MWTDGDGDFKCIGSIAELESLCGRTLDEVDLHRPSVDQITFVAPRQRTDLSARAGGPSTAGSTPVRCPTRSSTIPSRTASNSRTAFPADYICEAIDQTRGWFYSLHAIAALVSDSVAFRNCICLAHIVDKDGRKMSKSQGNIVDPYDVFDHVGADPLRWYLSCRIAPEVQKRISVDFVRGVASGFINTWWNTYAFFVMYAKLDRIDVTDDVPLAERPRNRPLGARAACTAPCPMSRLHWRPTTSTRRGGQSSPSSTSSATGTCVATGGGSGRPRRVGTSRPPTSRSYECLHAANRLMAPIMPFITETVHQNLVRGVDEAAPASVHMSEWPTPDPAARNDELLAEIDVVQRVVGLGRAARNSSGVRVRQPLSRLLVRTPDGGSATFVTRHEAQILEELNVKGVEMLAPDAELVSYRIKPNLPRIGKRYGKRVPAIRDALSAADGSAIAAAVAAGRTFVVDAGGETITFEPEDVLVESTSADGYACAEEGGYLVGLDTALNESLEREGLARELVRTVQEARKQAGLDVSDRITLRIDGTPEVEAALDAHRDFVMEETLAVGWGEADWSPAVLGGARPRRRAMEDCCCASKAVRSTAQERIR